MVSFYVFLFFTHSLRVFCRFCRTKKMHHKNWTVGSICYQKSGETLKFYLDRPWSGQQGDPRQSFSRTYWIKLVLLPRLPPSFKWLYPWINSIRLISLLLRNPFHLPRLFVYMKVNDFWSHSCPQRLNYFVIYIRIQQVACNSKNALSRNSNNLSGHCTFPLWSAASSSSGRRAGAKRVEKGWRAECYRFNQKLNKLFSCFVHNWIYWLPSGLRSGCQLGTTFDATRAKYSPTVFPWERSRRWEGGYGGYGILVVMVGRCVYFRALAV